MQGLAYLFWLSWWLQVSLWLPCWVLSASASDVVCPAVASTFFWLTYWERDLAQQSASSTVSDRWICRNSTQFLAVVHQDGISTQWLSSLLAFVSLIKRCTYLLIFLFTHPISPPPFCSTFPRSNSITQVLHTIFVQPSYLLSRPLVLLHTHTSSPFKGLIAFMWLKSPSSCLSAT